MKVITLVTYPIVTEYRDAHTVRLLLKDPHLSSCPIGILSVASLFRQAGWQVTLVDSNAAYLNHLELGGDIDTFSDYMAGLLAAKETSIYGFTSICSSYHLTLHICKLLKERMPSCLIVLGGPQATSTAKETMTQCPYVDYIMVGEVEKSIKAFVDHYELAPDLVPGLFYRRNREIRDNSAGFPPSVSEFPGPAYDLWDMDSVGYFSIEAGRGCPRKCKFCSTSRFFGNSYRIKSTNALISESLELISLYGKHKIVFIHDNLFRNPQACIDFCQSWMSESKLRGVEWSCSLRVDLISPLIAETLSQANCTGVFLGVETGSDSMQKIIRKNIRLEAAADSIRELHKNGIHTTISFIIGFPEETEEDLGKTLDFYHNVLRSPLSKPQAGALVVLGDTDYQSDGDDSMMPYNSRRSSSLAHRGPPMPSSITALIQASKTLFSSHHLPRLQHLDRENITECEHFLRFTTVPYRWLLVAAGDCLGLGLYDIFRIWRRQSRNRDVSTLSYVYYAGSQFRKDFESFAVSLSELPDFNRLCLDQYLFLCDAYTLSQEALDMLSKNRVKAIEHDANGSLVARSCALRDVRYSFSSVIMALQYNQDLSLVAESPSSLLLYSDGDDLIVEEPSKLTYAILNHLDSATGIDELVEQLSRDKESLLPINLRGKSDLVLKHAILSLCNRGVLDAR